MLTLQSKMVAITAQISIYLAVREKGIKYKDDYR